MKLNSRTQKTMDRVSVDRKLEPDSKYNDVNTGRAELEVAPSRWAALSFLALSVSLIVIDGTIVNVAIPQIIADLKFGFSQAQWISTTYALVFSALLITVGRLSDSFGRRRILMLGIIAFLAGSLLAGYATSAVVLIGARAIQGVGGAMVLPSSLSTVNATFRGRDRAIAFAVWGSVISGMAALGPLLGGWLTTYFSWPWIFYINIPLGVAILVGVVIFVPETRSEYPARSFDVIGMLTSALGLGGLVFYLIEGNTMGWWKPIGKPQLFSAFSNAVIGLFVALIAIGIFVLWQLYRTDREKEPLLDFELFRSKSFRWGNLAALSIAMGEFGLLFVLPLYLQVVLTMTALQSGALLAVMALGAFLSGGLAGEIARRTSPATVARMGLLLELIAAVLLAYFVGIGGSWVPLLVALTVYGIGLGMASAQLTSTILVDVPRGSSGQGSAVQSTARQIGTALGVGVIATILAVSLQNATVGSLSGVSDLPPSVARQIEMSVVPSAGASIVALKSDKTAVQLPAATRVEVVSKLDGAYRGGASNAIVFAGVFIAVGLVATLKLQRPGRTES